MGNSWTRDLAKLEKITFLIKKIIKLQKAQKMMR